MYNVLFRQHAHRPRPAVEEDVRQQLLRNVQTYIVGDGSPNGIETHTTQYLYHKSLLRRLSRYQNA